MAHMEQTTAPVQGEEDALMEYRGICPVCEEYTTFVVSHVGKNIWSGCGLEHNTPSAVD